MEWLQSNVPMELQRGMTPAVYERVDVIREGRGSRILWQISGSRKGAEPRRECIWLQVEHAATPPVKLAYPATPRLCASA